LTQLANELRIFKHMAEFCKKYCPDKTGDITDLERVLQDVLSYYDANSIINGNHHK
jgi:hypothetical protein